MDNKLIQSIKSAIINVLWTLFQIILIILKLIGIITISWWWVFAPTLISLGLCLLFILFYIFFVVLYNILRK